MSGTEERDSELILQQNCEPFDIMAEPQGAARQTAQLRLSPDFGLGRSHWPYRNQKRQGDFYAVRKVARGRATFLQPLQKTLFDSKVRIQRAVLTFLHPAVNSFAVKSKSKTQSLM